MATPTTHIIVDRAVQKKLNIMKATHDEFKSLNDVVVHLLANQKK